MAQDLNQAGELCGRDHILQRLRELDVELLPRSILNPAAGRIRVTVRKRNVGLNVVDGRAVAQIGPQHMDDGAIVGELDAIELDAGKPNGIRAKRTARGKHAHALGSAQTRRAHGFRPLGIGAGPVLRLGIGSYVLSRAAGRSVFEAPQQPQVREGVQTLNRCVGGKFRLKHDASLQMRRQKAVARNAELLRQVGMYVCDRFHAGHCTAWRLGALRAILRRGLPSCNQRLLGRAPAAAYA